MSKKVERALIIFQLILIIFQFASSGITVVNANSIELNLKIKHGLQIRDGGLVVINTMINLRNDAVQPLSNLEIGFSKEFNQNLDDVIAYDLNGIEFDLVKKGVTGDVFWVDIKFPEAVESGHTVNFSIFFVFSELVTYDNSNPTVYTVFFPECPVLPYDVARCEVKVNLPVEVTAKNSSLSELLSEVKAPLTAYSNLVAFISFVGDLHLLECNLNSEAILGPWSDLYFYDSYNIRNVGKTNLQDLLLYFPFEVKDIIAYDLGGSLDTAINNVDDVKEVRISLRYPLRGIVDSMTYHDAYAFTVKYKMNINPSLASTESWAHFRLSIRVFTPLNLTFKNMRLRINLPEGSKYLASSYSCDVSTSGLTPTLGYFINNINPIRTLYITVDYEYVVFWSAFRPIIWIGCITILISMVMFYRRRRIAPSKIISDENIKLIRSFTKIYDERMLLWSEIDSLEESIDRKSIKRKDYNRRKRIIQQRIRSYNNSFENLKDTIRQIEPRYAEFINRIETAENEISALRNNIRGLRGQYRSRKLSRRTYLDLKDDYEKRVERIKREIEGIIIELQS